MAQLKLRKEEPTASAPAQDPVFDPDGHKGEVGGMQGVKWIQGKYLFGNNGAYLGIAPESMWMTPLTPEQEKDRRLQLLKNKRFFNGGKVAATVKGTVPQAVLNAERENKQALAAESRAA